MSTEWDEDFPQFSEDWADVLMARYGMTKVQEAAVKLQALKDQLRAVPESDPEGIIRIAREMYNITQGH